MRWKYLWASYAALTACFIFGACGLELNGFVSINTGPIDPRGLVVVIGTPLEETPQSVQVVEGELPKGMAVQKDGTVQGIPEETGPFDFTLEFVDTGGSVERRNFHGEIIDSSENEAASGRALNYQALAMCTKASPL